jgi:hypothetical protein
LESCFFTKIDYGPRDKFPPITKAHRKFCVAARYSSHLYIYGMGEKFILLTASSLLHRRHCESCCSAAAAAAVVHKACMCVHNVLSLGRAGAAAAAVMRQQLLLCICGSVHLSLRALMILGFSTADFYKT